MITALSDYSIKVWDSNTGRLHRILKFHANTIKVLNPHPKDHNVFLSAGLDGSIIIWDLTSGNFINEVKVLLFSHQLLAILCY